MAETTKVAEGAQAQASLSGRYPPINEAPAAGQYPPINEAPAAGSVIVSEDDGGKRNLWKWLRIPSRASFIKAGEDPRKYAAVRFTTEFDSEDCGLNNKISARLFDGLGKLKAVVRRDPNGDVSCPEIGFVTKYLSVLYDTQQRNTLLSASSDFVQGFSVNVTSDTKIKMVTKYLTFFYNPDGFNVHITGSTELIRKLQFRAFIDAKARQGEVKVLKEFSDPKFKVEVACDVPSIGLPRTVVTFPKGQVSLQGNMEEDKRILSVSGFVAKEFMNGACVAEYENDNMVLSYKYKDKEMTFKPSLSLTAKELSLQFARQFNEINRLNYHYNFKSADWSAVYKFKPNEDFKVKAGYDSQVALGWISAWMGKEEVGAKHAPAKTKIQVMLQVQPNDVKSSALLVKFKKRWDL